MKDVAVVVGLHELTPVGGRATSGRERRRLEISPGKKITTRFLVLTKTKEPVVEEHIREVNPAAVKRTLVGVERVWRAIESGVFYPAPSVMACSGCGYREACRA